MTTEQFRTALKAQPFRPFTVRTADGHEYLVDHPEVAIQSRSGRTAVVANGEDSFAILDLLLVTALEFETSGRN